MDLSQDELTLSPLSVRHLDRTFNMPTPCVRSADKRRKEDEVISLREHTLRMDKQQNELTRQVRMAE